MEDNKMTVLIIENNKAASDLISLALKRAGYLTYRAYDGESGLELIHTQDSDLILLDLPDSIEPNAFDICEELKSDGIDVPVIVCVFSDDADLAAAMELNYIVKPFGIKALQNRIQIALLRSNLSGVPKIQTVGRFTINTRRASISKDGNPLPLTQREYTLFSFLAAKPGNIYTREELMTQVWGYEHYLGGERGVDTAIRRLRKKIEDDPDHPKVIVCKRGAGYFFAVQ